MATINEIKQQAEAVKNATQVGENTAERVGGALAGLAEIAEQQDSKLSDLSEKQYAFESELKGLNINVECKGDSRFPDTWVKLPYFINNGDYIKVTTLVNVANAELKLYYKESEEGVPYARDISKNIGEVLSITPQVDSKMLYVSLWASETDGATDYTRKVLIQNNGELSRLSDSISIEETRASEQEDILKKDISRISNNIAYTDNLIINEAIKELFIENATENAIYKLNIQTSSDELGVFINLYKDEVLVCNKKFSWNELGNGIIISDSTFGNLEKVYILINSNIVKDNMIKSSGKIFLNKCTQLEYSPSIKDFYYSCIPAMALPTKWYSLGYTEGTINFLSRLYLEGLIFSIKGLKGELTINNGRCAIVNSKPYIMGQSNTSSTYSCVVRSIYKEQKISFQLNKSTPYSAKNKLMNVLCIGDSLTDGGYPATMEFISKCHNKDIGNIIVTPIGTMIENKTIGYNGYEFTMRGCNEGRSGWSAHEFLRKVMITRRHALSSYATSKEQICLQEAWDSLGLGTKGGTRTYVPFDEDSEEQGNLIRETCHGYYDADPTEALWNWIVKHQEITSFEYNGIKYTFGNNYSTKDDAAQIAYIKYLCENPLNPFFDYNTVESSNGQYAFNLKTYLNRYKTLEDNGKTRLVVGSTAGSLVTDCNSYDVCRPTHVVIALGTNDANVVSAVYGKEVADDIDTLCTLVKKYSNDIKVCCATNHPYGAFYEKWDDIGYVPIKESLLELTWNVAKRLSELMANRTSMQYLPIYQAQSLFGDAYHKSYDTLDGIQRFSFGGDETHAIRPIDYLDRATMVLAWVYFT